MPRKFITQKVKDQNRESQRRSRARRNELINDLKKQVQEYQRQGASGSLELQRMVQAVTLENQRLRSLLNVHGVSQDDIHRYILSRPALPFKSPGSLHESDALKCKTCGSTSITLGNPPGVLLPRQHQNGTGNAQEKAKLPLPQSQQGNKRQCYGSDSNESDSQHSNKSPEVKPHLTTTNSFPNNTAPETIGSTDAMETSCDTAASILVDLHHNIDADQARAALGCKGSESCNVNNIKIFQLLEIIN